MTLNVAEWDETQERYVMTTGVKIALPKGTKIEAGKITLKPSGYMAGVKKRKAARDERRWLHKARPGIKKP